MNFSARTYGQSLARARSLSLSFTLAFTAPRADSTTTTPAVRRPARASLFSPIPDKTGTSRRFQPARRARRLLNAAFMPVRSSAPRRGKGKSHEIYLSRSRSEMINFSGINRGDFYRSREIKGVQRFRGEEMDFSFLRARSALGMICDFAAWRWRER